MPFPGTETSSCVHLSGGRDLASERGCPECKTFTSQIRDVGLWTGGSPTRSRSKDECAQQGQERGLLPRNHLTALPLHAYNSRRHRGRRGKCAQPAHLEATPLISLLLLYQNTLWWAPEFSAKGHFIRALPGLEDLPRRSRERDQGMPGGSSSVPDVPDREGSCSPRWFTDKP